MFAIHISHQSVPCCKILNMFVSNKSKTLLCFKKSNTIVNKYSLKGSLFDHQKTANEGIEFHCKHFSYEVLTKKGHLSNKTKQQAGAELGQAQLKLELELCYTSSVLIKLKIAELAIANYS